MNNPIVVGLAYGLGGVVAGAGLMALGCQLWDALMRLRQANYERRYGPIDDGTFHGSRAYRIR